MKENIPCLSAIKLISTLFMVISHYIHFSQINQYIVSIILLEIEVNISHIYQLQMYSNHIH